MQELQTSLPIDNILTITELGDQIRQRIAEGYGCSSLFKIGIRPLGVNSLQVHIDNVPKAYIDTKGCCLLKYAGKISGVVVVKDHRGRDFDLIIHPDVDCYEDEVEAPDAFKTRHLLPLIAVSALTIFALAAAAGGAA